MLNQQREGRSSHPVVAFDMRLEESLWSDPSYSRGCVDDGHGDCARRRGDSKVRGDLVSHHGQYVIVFLVIDYMSRLGTYLEYSSRHHNYY